MFCEECGSKLIDGAKFCDKCGAPAPQIEVAPAQQPAPAPVAPQPAAAPTSQPVPPQPTAAPVQPVAPKKKSKMPIIIAAVLLVLALVAGGVFIGSGGLENLGFGSNYTSARDDRDDDDEDDEDEDETEEESESETEEQVVETETEIETETEEIDPDPVVSISAISASSCLEPYGTKTYEATNLVDGSLDTVWVENVSGNGEGESVTFYMDGTQKVQGLYIHNGYLQSYHLYNANGRVAVIEVDFGNGVVVQKELFCDGFSNDSDDIVYEYEPDVIELDEPIYTDSITITIISAVAGDSYTDTCIAEITFY